MYIIKLLFRRFFPILYTETRKKVLVDGKDVVFINEWQIKEDEKFLHKFRIPYKHLEFHTNTNN